MPPSASSIAKGLEVKICGLKTLEMVEVAISAGADYIGFNHFVTGPRYIEPEGAEELAQKLPGHVKSVSLFVNPTNEDILRACNWADWIQLHGQEGEARCKEIAALSGKPILKAIPVTGAADIARADDFLGAADMILFDAKARELPGGNGIAFDWDLLQNRAPRIPWMLSGGLNPENVAEAIARTGATRVDVSSGVESTRGEKSPELIKAFIKTVRQESKD